MATTSPKHDIMDLFPATTPNYLSEILGPSQLEVPKPWLMPNNKIVVTDRLCTRSRVPRRLLVQVPHFWFKWYFGSKWV